MSKLFHRVTYITTNGLQLNNTALDIEFDIPFDDDLTPNLSTVTIWNLSKATEKLLKKGNPFSLSAGYKADSGLLLVGEIASVQNKWSNADRATIIKVLDSVPYNAKKTVNVTYKKNVKADSMIKDLAKRIGLKIAVLRLPTNKVYKNGHKIDGEGLQALQAIATDCGASCYISRGQSYIRPLKDGDDHKFKLSSETGLIGSPEYFEQEQRGKTIKGYNVVSLLQYRMNTASIIHLESREVKAKLRVRKGRHVCNGHEYYTKVEAIL